MCLITQPVLNQNCNNFTTGCEHRDRRFVPAQLFWENDVNTGRIYCDDHNGLDWARYQKGTVSNVTNPKIGSSFSIDLWWYTQSYVPQNFNKFTITWNYHNQISFYYTNPSFYAECWPMIDVNNPSITPTSQRLNMGNNDRRWRYFNCGVDTISYKYTISSTGVQGASVAFASPIIIPNGTTTLHFNEESITNFGVVYFRQLRLWSCYQCSLAFWHLRFLPGSPLYFNVYHCYDGLDPAGNLNDSQTAPTGGGTFQIFNERLDFHGYNVLYQPYNPVWCNETSFTYWNENTSTCSTLYNLSRLDDLVFSSQPSSRVDRWTMEFWVYVEENYNLTNGVNLIYDFQIGITLIRDKNDLNSLATLCFPQEYRDNLNGKIGPDIFDLYSSALNKQQDTLANSSSKWNFFRCAVDNSNQIMYLNDLPPIPTIPEYIFGGQQEKFQYRYFNIPIYVDITLENSALNKTRIFFKQWRIYREFLPQNTMKLKWKDMQVYANVSTWPLVFVVDFENVIRWANGVFNDLVYYTVDVDSSPIVAYSSLITTFIVGDKNPLFTTYPVFYMLNLCSFNQIGDGNNLCVNITVPGTCNANSVYCLDDNERWWCVGNNYLDVSNLSCNASCPAFTTRMPDSRQSGSYCRWDCTAQNYATCPNSPPAISQANYSLQTTIQCNPGFTRVYYRCIDSTLIDRSGFYLSSFYSYTPIIVDFAPTLQKSYYIEVWFLYDALHANIPVVQDEYYLLAPPHFIFQSANDQLFKYGNHNISGGSFFYNIASISIYEWNRIIIHNEYLAYNNTFQIKIYMNYNFVNPDVIIDGLDATLFPMNLKGFAFCDKPFATCTIGGTTYTPNWGTAFYKNISVWDDSMTSLYSIQLYNKLYSNLVKNMHYFYRFEFDTIDNATILDDLNPLVNSMSTPWWYLPYDNDKRVNFSINFDYGQTVPGSYVSQIDDQTNSKITVPCHSYCSRCYSPVQTNCYECKGGFALQGTTCYVATNYYFRTPTRDTSVTTIAFIDSYTVPVIFDIRTQNPITFNFWMRWFGIQFILPGTTYYPILYFKGVTSFFGFNLVNKAFMVQIDSLQAFENTKILPHVGIWTHFSFSVYRSSDVTVFPHMFNFMIQNEIQAPLLTFNVKNTPVDLDNITFSTQNVAIFSNLRFYSNFYGGSYGHVTSSAQILTDELILEYRLTGSGNQNCVADSELKTQTVSGIDLDCVTDYSPYDNNNIQCNNDIKYFDIALAAVNPPCEFCDSSCLTQCFKADNKGCTCTFDSMLYWLETQQPPQDYNCYRVQSINWSYYEPVTVDNISNTTNDEIAIEFWVHIHSYTGLKFDYLDVIWNKHARVRVINDGGIFKAQCFPYSDSSNLTIYPHSYDINFTEYSWFYVRCASDNYYKKFYINTMIELDYPAPLPSFDRGKTTTLTISENIPTTSLNYGFSFIRELKLSSSYHFKFWDPSYNYLDPLNYKYILHYFRNTFDNGNESITDSVSGNQVTLIRKSDLIGYNYVVGFNELTQCPEGQIFQSSICQNFASQKCK